jgi:hypothetical protein
MLTIEPRQERLDRAVHRLDVEVEGKIPVVVRALEHRALVHVAGDIGEHVEPAELLGDGLGQRLDRRGGAHVERKASGGLEPLELFLIHIGRDHLGALGDESLGDGAADALSRRGNERDLALQSSGHCRSPVVIV